jgi:DNA-binding NarL/FixJ family response regulator
MKNPNYKIVIADDHKLIISGIKQIIEVNGLGTVVAQANDGLELLQLLKETAVDLLILDINMPKLNGIEAAEKILKRHPTISILMLSQYENIELIKKLKILGVKGYLTKIFEISQLVEAINEISDNQLYFPSLKNESNFKETDKHELTKREEEIIKLLAVGKTSKEIADILFLSEYTIETHRKNIMRKLEVNSIIALLNKAKDLGYIF